MGGHKNDPILRNSAVTQPRDQPEEHRHQYRLFAEHCGNHHQSCKGARPNVAVARRNDRREAQEASVRRRVNGKRPQDAGLLT